MRFTIRDILLLTVIVAVATGWGLDRWRLARRAAELELKTKMLMVDAEVSRAEALLRQKSALPTRDQVLLLEQAQKLYSEVSAVEQAAKEAVK